MPFTVPVLLGSVPSPRTVVTSYLPGTRLQPAAVRAAGPLAPSLGRAIAAIHDLPTAVVAEAGLPVRTAAGCADDVRALVARADPIGAVPHELVHRWSAAAADPALWRFRPSVVHGSLAAECLLITSGGGVEHVAGVLGWSGLAVGDPARDLAWVIGLPGEGAAAAVLAAHAAARPRSADPRVPQRALLYAELEVLRWLLHGIDGDDAAVVDDATGMLEALLASVLERTAGPLGGERSAPLTVAEVERMLDARAHRATGARTPVAAHAARSSSAE